MRALQVPDMDYLSCIPAKACFNTWYKGVTRLRQISTKKEIFSTKKVISFMFVRGSGISLNFHASYLL